MGARSKAARSVRLAEEFNLSRLSHEIRSPKDGNGSINSWSLAQIFQAREEQMNGSFVRPARMAEQMRTDDALAVAFENRLAPQRCISVELTPAKGARAKAIAKEGEALFGPKGVGVTPEVMHDLTGCLVNHGIAVGYLIHTPREDGSRVDVSLYYWPIEYVRWDEFNQTFMAKCEPGSPHTGDINADPSVTQQQFISGTEVPIVHGDGRWVLFAKHSCKPFRHAAILSACLVWARHAFALRDWAKGSVAHGNAKVIGEMPEGVSLQKDGALTSEAAAFLELLRAIGSADSPIGIRPAGSKTEFLTNNSSAWQVWSELVANADKAAARIYLGTDGTLGSQGGAPGIDITALFGVAATIVRGDLECLQRGIDTGVIQPWCAINFGDSSLAPSRRYVIPNEEEESVRENYSKRSKAFHDAVSDLRKNGFAVDQQIVESLANVYGIETPSLPEETEKAPSIALASADIALVVSVNEARASAGLGPLQDVNGVPDPDGRLTVE